MFLSKTRMLENYLSNTSSERILSAGKKKLIPAFQSAARQSGAYKKLLAEKNVDIRRVTDETSFQGLVPVIDKSIFNNDLALLCRNGAVGRIKSAMVSSGFSRSSYSYGISGRESSRALPSDLDLLIDSLFDTGRKSTFVINCLGMGTALSTTLPLAQTSVRADMAVELARKIHTHFEQIIIFSNTFFMKEIIELGTVSGLDWKTMSMHLVIGEDWFPESYRDYLAHLIGADLTDTRNKKTIISNMGICELGISLLRESPDTVRLRRLAENDAELRTALFGAGTEICPILFQYFPFQIFLEEKDGELIFTDLNRDSLVPLIRYSSKDRGRVYSYDQLREILTKLNHRDYIPRWKLPLAAVMGRKGKHIQIKEEVFTPEQVKAGLYRDFTVAASTTGYFRMSNISGQLKIEVQLKENTHTSPELEKKFYQALNPYLKTDFELVVYPYKQFPYGMGLIYEQKFRYIENE